MMNFIWSFLLLSGIFLSSFFGNLSGMTEALMDGAKEAVNLCVIMAAVVGLWSGIMEIGVESGVLSDFSKKIDPFLSWLFPNLPKDCKAREYIGANCAANILGLGWAATPAGLLAMEELKKLEGERKKQGNQNAVSDGTASNEMCTFLVLNISSLQLIPVNLIAYRSQYGSVNPSIILGPAILATAASSLAAIFFCKIMNRT
ncbi:MAG: nucleoside recognition protein [Lachnospiraceae bacterium]|nr:nucleoside recognition protein [Lachnospiraceae bacterium]